MGKADFSALHGVGVSPLGHSQERSIEFPGDPGEEVAGAFEGIT